MRLGYNIMRKTEVSLRQERSDRKFLFLIADSGVVDEKDKILRERLRSSLKIVKKANIRPIWFEKVKAFFIELKRKCLK